MTNLMGMKTMALFLRNSAIDLALIFCFCVGPLERIRFTCSGSRSV